MLGKRGQFFLIAALVISGILIGLATIYTSLQTQKEDTSVYDLSSELNFENSQVIDQGVFNGLSQEQINQQIVNLTDYYAAQNPDSNIIILYGNQTQVTVRIYNVSAGNLGINVGGPESRVTEYHQDITQNGENVVGQSITLQIGNHINQTINIVEGQNFFSVIKTDYASQSFVATAGSAGSTGPTSVGPNLYTSSTICTYTCTVWGPCVNGYQSCTSSSPSPTGCTGGTLPQARTCPNQQLTCSFNSSQFTYMDINGNWGTNAVSFWQVPGHADIFIGRIGQGDGIAVGTLVPATLQWGSSKSIGAPRKILSVPFTLMNDPSKRMNHAYDPSIVSYNNNYWVAFECCGLNADTSSCTAGTVNTCIGPITDIVQGSIDTAHTYLIINGTNYGGSGYSASVPKLFVYKSKIYLYWSTVKADATSDAFQSVTSRGVELVQDTSTNQLWAKNQTGMPVGHAITSIDPLTTEVLGLGTDSSTNTVADVQQIFTDGSKIYAIAGLGGGNCLTPTSSSTGCYRMSISYSTTPLGPRIFNAYTVPETLFPSSPQEYGRFWTLSDGSSMIMGHFLPPTSVQTNSRIISSPPVQGYYYGYFQIPGGTSYFNSCTSGTAGGAA